MFTAGMLQVNMIKIVGRRVVHKIFSIARDTLFKLKVLIIYILDTHRDLCFMKYQRGTCSEPSTLLATKSQCCCMVDSMDAPGIAWGAQCEPCPSMRDSQYKILCPNGPGMDHDGGGNFIRINPDHQRLANLVMI